MLKIQQRAGIETFISQAKYDGEHITAKLWTICQTQLLDYFLKPILHTIWWLVNLQLTVLKLTEQYHKVLISNGGIEFLRVLLILDNSKKG